MGIIEQGSLAVVVDPRVVSSLKDEGNRVGEGVQLCG